MRWGARAGSAVGALLLVCASGPLALASPSPSPTATSSASGASGAVTVRVLSVSPVVPPATTAVTPVTVTLSLTNTTSDPVSNLVFTVNRESPKENRAALQKELANPVEDDSQPSTLPSLTVSGELDAHQTRQVTYTLNASTDFSQPHVLCLCTAGVYPLDFTLRASTGSSRSSTAVGWAQTYIASVPDAQPVQVSWLWPLLDRPHRLRQDNVFFDDDLAGSVSPGGRLDRALRVLEQVGASAQLTAIVDPELLDELAVMSTGYTVVTDGKVTAGTGGAAARSWLARLKAVAPTLGGVSMTPYADPDVDAASGAGLTWSSALPTVMQQQITAATGLTDQHDIAWPAAQTITPQAFDTMVSDGAKTFVLDDATLTGGKDDSPELDALASLGSSGAQALVVDRDSSALVDAAINVGKSGRSVLPELTSTAAMAAIQEPGVPHLRVFTPDRDADVDPALAEAAITATTTGPFTPASARAAVSAVAPTDRGNLVVPGGSQAAQISPVLLASARSASGLVTALESALQPADAARLLTGIPGAVQRALSAGWRSDPGAGQAYAAALGATGTSLTYGVKILPPAGGYSLASSDAPLYVTVQNTLAVPVKVKITVVPNGGVKGFRADDGGVQTIPAESVRRVTVQTHVARAGHFLVTAQLTTPTGTPLGAAQRLSIYSKALGTIGTVITIGASAVLVLAILVRLFRKYRFRRRLRIGGETP